nr:MAG TPA: hypothetical protein [Caudoviricetes sp.]
MFNEYKPGAYITQAPGSINYTEYRLTLPRFPQQS